MSLSHFYNRTATSQREDFVSGSTVKKTYQDYLEEFPCHMQPLEESISVDGPGAFGKDWLIMCPILDIREGDKLIIDDNAYRVAGVETYDFGRQTHMEVSVRDFKS